MSVYTKSMVYMALSRPGPVPRAKKRGYLLEAPLASSLIIPQSALVFSSVKHQTSTRKINIAFTIQSQKTPIVPMIFGGSGTSRLESLLSLNPE